MDALYMTGAIEPYYYPKTRDGLFKRPLHCSGNSGSYIKFGGNMEDEAANFLITDKSGSGLDERI